MSNSNKSTKSTKQGKGRQPKPNVPAARTRNKGQQQPTPRSKIPKDLVERVCSLTDPFCKEAWNSKLPDHSNTRSMAYQLKYRTSVATDAAGNGANLFLLGALYSNYVATGITAGVVSFTSSVGNSGLTISPETYRIVSAGIRVRSTASPLSSSGMVRIRGFPSQTGTLLTSIDSATFNCNFSEDIPLQDCKDVCVLFQRTNYPRAEEFTLPAATQVGTGVLQWVAPGWGPVLISLIGGPVSSTPVDLEVIINYELTFDDTSNLQLAATAPAKDTPGLNTLANSVSEEVGNVVRQGASYLAREVARAAASKASSMFAYRSAALMLM
jgi:hypothetical protein